MKLLITFMLAGVVFTTTTAQTVSSVTSAARPKSSKVVVLTFDDACVSQYNYVAPLLKHFGYNATFYICEFPRMFGDSTKSMNWRQIKELSDMGFEIGNHTWHHRNIDSISNDQFEKELSYIERKCDTFEIPKPTTFAYPAYRVDSTKWPILVSHGYLAARTGGDVPCQVGYDNRFLIPSFTLKGSSRRLFLSAVRQAKEGEIIVFTIHGVPDIAHPWVNTSPELLKKYFKYLHKHHFEVVSMQDASSRLSTP